MNASAAAKLRLYWLVVLLCPAGASTARSQINLHGTVRDASGAVVAGSTVKLTCEAPTGRSVETVAAADGSYRFAGLALCRYLAGAQFGQLVSAPVTMIVDAGSQKEMQFNFVISGAPEPATGIGSTASVALPPRPTFAASSIRGLVDPGGYSAPANAAAASGLLSGMADVNRMNISGSGDCASHALPKLRSAHDARPDDSAVTLDLAEALVSEQRFDEARTLLVGLPPVTGTSSMDLRATRAMAHIDEGTGQFESAARAYHRLTLAGHSPEDGFAEGYELILAGRLAEAASVYRDDLHLHPRSTSSMIGAGITEFLEDHTTNAIALLLKAAETDTQDRRPYPFLAAASGVSAAEGERVLAAMTRHLALVPQDAAAHLALAMELTHLRTQQSAAVHAEHELRQALGNDPSLAEAHFQLASLLSGRGANSEAVRELELTVQLDPERKEAHYRLALALRKEGKPEAAALQMQRFQDAREQDAATGADIRRYLSVLKQPAEARMSCSEQSLTY